MRTLNRTYALICLTTLILIQAQPLSAYDKAHTDTVTMVQTHYSSDGLDSFGFSTTPPQCSSAQMYPHPNVTENGSKAMLSIAMSAYLAGKRLTAYYTSSLSDSCRVEYLRISD